MTTRDPRSGDPPNPTSTGGDGAREPTQSLNLGPDEQAAAVLALGTYNRPVTAIESPGARGKTPLPPAPRPRRADSPTDYIDTVLGSYRVIELLGKGGMGYVYRAEHVKLGREVALKLLRSDYASRRDAVSRFFQEARTVNRVRHRNIVDVTDFVELDDGTTYIVMELLTGTSLGAWAQSGVDLARAIAVLLQICDGLSAAHQVGVVHRDLKPDNVVVVPTPDGGELVKLLDFGVAKLLNRDDEDVGFQTAAGSVIGTPAYMSPEQAGGMVIDARSDIYSLGAIMYELFTGQPMFRGRSFGEYVRKHLTEMPVPPHETPGGAGIDLRLEALILRCLDKDPDQRFAHISELREALLHLLSESDAGALYPPSFGTRAGSGPRPLSTPLPPMASALPLPPPISQSSPSLQGSEDPGASLEAPSAAVHSSGPHRAHASAPYASGPHDVGPLLAGASAAHSSGPYDPDPHSSGPHHAEVMAAYAPTVHAAGPHASGPFSASASDSYRSGSHPAQVSDSQAAGPFAANPLPGAPVAGPAPAGPPGTYPPPLTLDGAYSLPPPLTLDGAYKLPGSPPAAAASPPWWLWFSAGALAVGIGIATALWYSGHERDLSTRPVLTSRPGTAATVPGTAVVAASDTSPSGTSPSGTPAAGTSPSGTPAAGTSPSGTSPSGTPAAGSAAAGTTAAGTSATTTPPEAHPALVEVRFNSAPSGSVFADGQPAELCRTPCAFDIDPADGGPTDQRVFVVRRAGYLDSPVTVDLAGAQREFQVTLQHAEPTAVHSRDARTDGKDGGDRHTKRRPARKGSTRADTAPDASAEPSEQPDTRSAKKPAPPIDPTDTLDPFRKK